MPPKTHESDAGPAARTDGVHPPGVSGMMTGWQECMA